MVAVVVRQAPACTDSSYRADLPTLRDSARAVWDGIWHSSVNIVTQVPADLTYNLPAYRAIATDPLPLAISGATLALVLLGLRTLLGSMVGRDHVIPTLRGDSSPRCC
jgi:hypothetical protein